MEWDEIILYTVLGIVILIFILACIGLVYNVVNTIDYGQKVGTIINKEIEPAHSYITYVHTGYVNVPMTHYKGDTYKFELEKEENGKAKTIWIEVSEEEYSKYEIGDYYGGEVNENK